MDANIVVGAVIVLLVVGAVAVLVRNKLKGKSSCGCSGCGSCGCCSMKQGPADEGCGCCPKKKE